MWWLPRGNAQRLNVLILIDLFCSHQLPIRMPNSLTSDVPALNHLYSSSPLTSRITDLSRTPVTDMQTSSFPLQLTSMCLDISLSQLLNLSSLPVLRAQNLPHIKTISRKESRFYVTVIAGARTWHTRAVRSIRNHVEWNEEVDAL
jgi:hypothetical protein